MSGHIILQNKLESSHELSLAEEFVQLYYDKLDKQQYVSNNIFNFRFQRFFVVHDLKTE